MLILVLRVVLGGIYDPEDKVDNNCQQEHDGQDGRTKSIIEASLAPQPDGLGAPMVRYQRIEKGEDRYSSEEEGRDEGGAIAKVEHAQGQGPKHDGEVEPREECTLIGKENLGFNASGKSNTLAWRRRGNN